MACPPSTTKRPRPRIFWAWTLTITAALLAVVWVGSMKVAVFGAVTPRFVIGSGGGGVAFAKYEPTGVPGRFSSYLPGPSPSVNVQVLDSFDAQWWFYGRTDPWLSATRRLVFAPLWPFVLLTGVPGVWILVKTRRRTNPNACPACGYDRTGLPQAAPCPECGNGAAAR